VQLDRTEGLCLHDNPTTAPGLSEYGERAVCGCVLQRTRGNDPGRLLQLQFRRQPQRNHVSGGKVDGVLCGLSPATYNTKTAVMLLKKHLFFPPPGGFFLPETPDRKWTRKKPGQIVKSGARLSYNREDYRALHPTKE